MKLVLKILSIATTVGVAVGVILYIISSSNLVDEDDDVEYIDDEDFDEEE